jgi:hypothetical protein
MLMIPFFFFFVFAGEQNQGLPHAWLVVPLSHNPSSPSDSIFATNFFYYFSSKLLDRFN